MLAGAGASSVEPNLLKPNREGGVTGVRVAELQLWEEPREHLLRSLCVVALLVFNVADVLTTQLMLARGGIEMNPLSAWLIDQGALAHTKISVVAFIAVAAAAASARRQVSTALAVVAGIYLAVVASNTVQLVLAG
jgi:hypothetical protein